MAIAVKADPGGADANSYVSAAEADAYFALRPHAAAWTGSPDRKAQALLFATKRLELLHWRGTRATTGQALKWPRWGVDDEDGRDYGGDRVPQPVRWATLELALSILAAKKDPVANSGLEPFERLKAGPVELVVDESYSAGELPEHVRRIVAPLLASAGGGSAFSLRMARG